MKTSFDGFVASDFEYLSLIGRIKDEQYLDHKRMLHSKIEEFMLLLDMQIKPLFQFKQYGIKIAQITGRHPSVWSAFYFYNTDPKLYVQQFCVDSNTEGIENTPEGKAEKENQKLEQGEQVPPFEGVDEGHLKIPR